MASSSQRKLRNLGPVSNGWLLEVGVKSIEDLQRIDVVPTYLMVCQNHSDASLNLLWALEGARREIDWRELSSADKARLKSELEQLNE